MPTTTTKTQKPKNPYRISVDKTLEMHGIDESEMYDSLSDSIVPACCSKGCECEPDGHCEHKCPSVLLVMGVI